MTSTADQIATAIAMGKIQQLARKLGGAGIANIEKAYRTLVRSAHPDTGGSAAEFRALTAGRDELMKRANALLLAFASVPGEEPPQKEKLH